MSAGKVSAALRDHDNVAKSRRGILSPRQNQGLPRNAVIGIVFGLIALIACAFLAVLVWRLVRLYREESSRPPIDLLEEARRSSIRPDDTEKGLGLGDMQYDKPLPRMPSGISVLDQHVLDISPAPQQSVHLSIGEMPLVQLPPPVIYPNKATLADDINTPPSSSSSQSVQREPVKRRVNERFKVVNVTEADSPDLQSAFRSSPDHARGRYPPFPSKAKQASQDEKDGPSTTGSSSYHLHLSADPRGSDTTSRSQLPLTIVAPRTVSNVVVEGMQTVRRPDGVERQGRLVTLSVLIEDTEPSSSGTSTHGHGFAAVPDVTARRDTLDQFLEVYASRRGDLPPYTPR